MTSLEDTIFNYALKAGALGALVYVVYSDRLDRKSMLELYSGLKDSLDRLSSKIDQLIGSNKVN